MPNFDLSEDINLLIRFWEIRTENGIEFPNDLDQFKIACRKSALLRRMLDGKEPLPIPPPVAHSYPWYSLIEEGIGHPYEVWEGADWLAEMYKDYKTIVIDQTVWKIIEKLDEDSWIVTYSYGKEDKRKFADSKWHVYTIGSRIPRNPNDVSSNKLWEIKLVE
jgi:hypothetical protein